MPRKSSQQARLALKCNPGEGTHATKAAISPQGSSNERGTPTGTQCLTLRNAGRNKVQDVAQRRRSEQGSWSWKQAGWVAPCADLGGSAQRPRGLPGLWSEPDVRCIAVKWSVTGPKARAAFMASPLMSVARVACKVAMPVPQGPSRRGAPGTGIPLLHLQNAPTLQSVKHSPPFAYLLRICLTALINFVTLTLTCPS